MIEVKIDYKSNVKTTILQIKLLICIDCKLVELKVRMDGSTENQEIHIKHL